MQRNNPIANIHLLIIELAGFTFNLLYGDFGAVNFCSVQCRNGLLAFCFVRHFNECTAFGTAISFIPDNSRKADFTIGREKLDQIIINNIHAEIGNKNMHSIRMKIRNEKQSEEGVLFFNLHFLFHFGC